MNDSKVFLERNDILSERVIRGLESRQMAGYYCKTKEEALKKALSLIEPKSTVAWGGAETLGQIGFYDALKDVDCKVINRDTAETREHAIELMRSALSCDTFFMSSNAITADGELVNIDGMGNRTAALIFGPKSIVVVVGMNKVCSDLDDAMNRARTFAAPMNATRLKTQTPCALTGSCANCKKPESICAHIVITRLSKIPHRIKVILVGESLGY
ncbi:MAG: lactate utilization protein [Elusimicrobiota bacterium]|jgi:L-lactate utilization protein LutB|nr:lactate utilization protein [Elusimicrobiota bacterium]